jgi:hypothetical protein
MLKGLKPSTTRFLPGIPEARECKWSIVVHPESIRLLRLLIDHLPFIEAIRRHEASAF